MEEGRGEEAKRRRGEEEVTVLGSRCGERVRVKRLRGLGLIRGKLNFIFGKLNFIFQRLYFNFRGYIRYNIDYYSINHFNLNTDPLIFLTTSNIQ